MHSIGAPPQGFINRVAPSAAPSTGSSYGGHRWVATAASVVYRPSSLLLSRLLAGWLGGGRWRSGVAGTTLVQHAPEVVQAAFDRTTGETFGFQASESG